MTRSGTLPVGRREALDIDIRIELLSDDRIAVRKAGDAFTAYGTPWPGDQGAARYQKSIQNFSRHAILPPRAPMCAL